MSHWRNGATVIGTLQLHVLCQRIILQLPKMYTATRRHNVIALGGPICLALAMSLLLMIGEAQTFAKSCATLARVLQSYTWGPVVGWPDQRNSVVSGAANWRIRLEPPTSPDHAVIPVRDPRHKSSFRTSQIA